jgi:hypothetical protein
MHTSATQAMPVGHGTPPAHAGRRQVEPPHTYGGGQGVDVPQLRIAHRYVVVQRSAPPQSESLRQSRTQAPKLPQLVPEGQSVLVPQPLHTPPGAVAVQVD